MKNERLPHTVAHPRFDPIVGTAAASRNLRHGALVITWGSIFVITAFKQTPYYLAIHKGLGAIVRGASLNTVDG